MDTFPNYIDGAWVDSPDAIVNLDPSNLEVLGRYARADASAVGVAIAAARAAFPAWSTCPGEQRANILDAVGSRLLEQQQELGRLLSSEEGKTLKEGIGEVVRAGRIFKFFAGEALRPGGELLDSVRPGVRVEITREPAGVVGLLTPWNFPIAIPAWKIAPALAFGNCVVFKPAELVPGSAWMLAKLLHEAGIPRGVFNLLMGAGGEVGRAIVESPDVDAVSFTGSVGVGRGIALAAVGTGKRFQLEMGGKNPLVVLEDADLDLAVEVAVNGAFFSTGQRCTASSRLIVVEAVHDAFVERIIGRMAKLVTGPALAPDTDIGPVASAEQLGKNLEYLEIGRAEGAEVVGGNRPPLAQRGHYMKPALFLESSNEMRINREEVFGPLASVIRARDYDEALAIANDTPMGLSAGICTRSLARATHFKRHSQAGMVMVNLPTAGVDYHVPFGGRKASSHGPREQGSYARDFFTTVKTAYEAAG
ncbi:MAG: aldehyde dehydrogenase family protein [Steroidobacteraceae bacterium]|nr:aldehyde dehydrogenase family protein [Steroidobacteraceae bacterium]